MRGTNWVLNCKAMAIPKNVFWFEVLLYASLALDALSVAFMDRSENADLLQLAMVIAGGMILLQLYLVRLAAQSRQGWPRWVLGAILLISAISLAQVTGESGITLEGAIEIVSCALTAVGLYLSFTGDAQRWFE